MKSIVVSASKNYFLGMKALLNSFEHYHDTTEYEVYVLSFDLSQEQLDFVESKPYTFVDFINAKAFPEPYSNNSAWATKIPRFKYAAEKLNGVCMMLDADMFFTANMDMYFDIAAAGFIVGGSNGSNIYFGENYTEKWGEPIEELCVKTIGSVPTILDLDKYRHIWLEIYETKHNMKPFCDFELLNIMLMKHKYMNRILAIPSQQVTGLHHFQLRPDTRVVEKMGKLFTSDGLEVLMCHGKYWQPNYELGLTRNMTKYAKRFYKDYNEKNPIEIGSNHSLTIIKKQFSRWTDESNS